MYMFVKRQLKELKAAYEHCSFENVFSFSALKGFMLVLRPEVGMVVKKLLFNDMPLFDYSPTTRRSGCNWLLVVRAF